MTGWAINLIGSVFTACWQWFSSLMTSIDGFGYVIAAILIILIVSMFLMPLRGGRVAVGGLADYSMGTGKFKQHQDRPRYTHWNAHSRSVIKQQKGS